MNLLNQQSSSILNPDVDVPSSSDYQNRPESTVKSLETEIAARIGDPGKEWELVSRIKELIRFEASRKQYNDQYDFAKPDDIKRYCLDRLEEIRFINKVFHVPSGFVCIAAFIGFLSRLAYGNNVERQTSDSASYRAFITNFMPQKYNGTELPLYKAFRCGIVHAMSFDSEYADIPSRMKTLSRGGRNDTAQIVITHDPVGTSSQGLSLTLNATDFCDDVEKAIHQLFSDPVCLQNAKQFMTCQRPIQKNPASSGKGASVSSSVNINLPSSLVNPPASNAIVNSPGVTS